MTSLFLRAALLGCSLLALSACSKGKQPSAQPPAQVGVINAQPHNVPLTRDLVGRLSAYRSANVIARVAGVLLKRDYKEGSEVKQGQLLFQIDPAPFKATLDNANAQVAQARAAYTNARVDADQATALAPKGYVSKAQLQSALATERSDKAAVQAAEANAETARINLGYASVTSPIAGRAGEQQVTEGAMVGQGTATLLATVNQIDPLYVNFTISLGELNELRQAAQQGQLSLNQPDKATVQVSLPDSKPYPESGTVDFSSPSVDPSTGAVSLRAVLPNPEFTLLPGSYVTLKVNLGERHGVFLIPQPAVQRDIEGTYVLVVGKDEKVAHRDVSTSGMAGVDWIITSGLAPGDRVIVSGIQTVQVGATAKATPWQAPGSNGTPGASASATSGNAE